MTIRLLSVVLLSAAAACAQPDAVRDLEPPTREGSGEPNLSPSGDGVLMSWLQEEEGGGHGLWMARRTEAGWTTPRRIVQGTDFFVNWADFPSVVAGGDGSLWAHWLQRRAGEGLAYDVRVARSDDDGATWSDPWTPHEDGTATEHGFVTLFPTSDGVGMAWLDGRGYAPGADGTPAAMEMSLRSREATSGGDRAAEIVVDGRTCDCCQTDVAVTDAGPVLVYRNRSADEVRDIYIARGTRNGWSEGTPVHDDGWVIAGCPVNGPAVDARGMDVAVAWFTGVGDAPHVYVAFSRDGGAGFGDPVRVDGGDPAGRVDLRFLPDGDIAVSWLERTGGDKAELRLARVSPDGTVGPPVVVASSSAARASGFPRISTVPWAPDQLVVAWTDVSGQDRPMVRVSQVEVGS